MRRLAPLLCLLGSSCYLHHGLERGDGGIDGDVPLPDGACCMELMCLGEDACEAGEECTPVGCMPACDGPRCGGLCCAADDLCVGDRCVPAGAPCADDSGCAATDRCDPVARRCAPAPRSACMVARPFEPVVRWEDTSVMAINVPLVVPLDDDAFPDVVVITVPSLDGSGLDISDRNSMIAYSGDDGRRLWELGMFTGPCSHSPPAAGDVDGDGSVEIVALARVIEPHTHYSEDLDDPFPCIECGEPLLECGPFRADHGANHGHQGCVDPRVVHVHAECPDYGDPPGALLIISSTGEVERTVLLPILPRPNQMDAVEIVDLDADGSAEIFTHGVVIDRDGIRWSDERLSGVGTAIGDLDGDGLQEIVTAQHAFGHDGTLRWSVEADELGHPVIGDVLRDPMSRGPQVIVADGRTVLVRDGTTGEVLFGPILYGTGLSAGPPNLADFDGDGRIEIGVVAEHGFVVIDPDLGHSTRWTVPTFDLTPGTVGASAFDFDADGAMDVAYSDECHLRILSGRDGTTLYARSNSSITVWEYPVVADVDGDREAEIVFGSNVRLVDQLEQTACRFRADPWVTTEPGVRVLEDRLHNWGETRAIWNQHAYHVDNVLDDGAIPALAPPSWETHGTWRANPRAPDDDDVHLPSLRVTALAVEGPRCALDVVVRARVENGGSRASEPGVRVVLANGAGSFASAQTTRALLPGAAEWVVFPSMSGAALGSGAHAAIDPPSGCAAGERTVSIESTCVP